MARWTLRLASEPSAFDGVIEMWWKLLMGLAVGGGLGYGWSRVVRRQGGTCPMTNSWPLATLLGAGLGLFAVMQFHTSGTDACPVSMLAGSRPATAQTDPRDATEARHMAQVIQTDTDFESKVLQAGKPVLVDFYADWCQPCKYLSPVIEELAGELGDRADVYKVDVDKLQGVAAKYGIQSIPTVIVFNGGQPASTFVGVRGKEDYVAAVNEAAGG